MLKKNTLQFEYIVPDNTSLDKALKRTTHLAIATHPDDLEIMAAHGIIECYKSKTNWFTGIVLTDGSGSAREGGYKKLTDKEMIQIRSKEQKRAAKLGKYNLLIELKEKSSDLKSISGRKHIVKKLSQILQNCKPKHIYLHNPFDKHLSHIACLRVSLAAIQKSNTRAKSILGCEVWRDLDWISDKSKVVLNLTKHQELALKLIRCFDSQISGGKRYDLATIGRRRAHATFLESHITDKIEMASYAVDLKNLAEGTITLNAFIKKHLKDFSQEVQSLIRLKY